MLFGVQTSRMLNGHLSRSAPSTRAAIEGRAISDLPCDPRSFRARLNDLSYGYAEPRGILVERDNLAARHNLVVDDDVDEIAHLALERNNRTARKTH